MRIPRAVLRVAHRIGLMPALAESQTAFAAAMATALRQRSDVRADNLDVVAYVATNMAMGIIHASIWYDKQPFTEQELRETLVQASSASSRPRRPKIPNGKHLQRKRLTRTEGTEIRVRTVRWRHSRGHAGCYARRPEAHPCLLVHI